MDPKLEAIRASIARINELSADELETLKADVAAYFDEVDAQPTTTENVVILQELGAAISAIMTQTEEIAAQEAQAEADKEAARAIRQSIDDKAGDDEGSEPDPTATGDVIDPAISDPALVAAGTRKYRATPGAMNGGKPANLSPTMATERTALVAGGNVTGKVAGTAFTSSEDLANAICNTLRGMHRNQSHGRVVVASANFLGQFPEERIIRSNDPVGNSLKFDNVTSLKALVATGGICAPVNVDWTLDTWATPERPLKSGFAQYGADHGGLTYRNPPTVAALAGATAVWTEATDASPGGATKPVLAIACASPTTIYVDAVATRLGFGNMMNQFDPDTITANTDLAIVAAARIAELNLLTKLQAACTLDITSGQALGAARDWLTTIDLITANFRYTHRLPQSQTLTIVLPEWVKNMIRADRLNELAHDDAGTDVFGLPDSWIDAMLAVRGIKAIWTLDALPVNGSVYPTQQFTGFTASAAAPAYPAKVVWNVYIEGSVQFLDGGLLNLGVVRDATLDATNDYETFIETFEGLAFRGFSGGALQVVSTLTVNGQSSATQVY
jgi:hypothetical protein